MDIYYSKFTSDIHLLENNSCKYVIFCYVLLYVLIGTCYKVSNPKAYSDRACTSNFSNRP